MFQAVSKFILLVAIFAVCVGRLSSQCTSTCFPGKCDKKVCVCPKGLEGPQCTKVSTSSLLIDAKWLAKVTFSDGSTQAVTHTPVDTKERVFWFNRSPINRNGISVSYEASLSDGAKKLINDKSSDWRFSYELYYYYGTWAYRESMSGTHITDFHCSPRPSFPRDKNGFRRCSWITVGSYWPSYSKFQQSILFLFKIWTKGQRYKHSGGSVTTLVRNDGSVTNKNNPTYMFPIRFRFVDDHEPPKSSFCSTCPIIQISERNGKLMISSERSKWSDKTLADTIFRFFIYKLEYNNVLNGIHEGKKRLFEADLPNDGTPAAVTLSDPGSYVIYLNVTDVFGYSSLARQIFVLNLQEPTTSASNPITVNGKFSSRDDKITFVKDQTLKISWVDHFTSPLHASRALEEVGTILPAKVSSGMDSRSSSKSTFNDGRYRDIQAISNVNGIVKYEISVKLDEDGAADNFKPVTETEFKSEANNYFGSVEEGKTYKITIRATDYVGKSVEDFVRVILDTKKPIIPEESIKVESITTANWTLVVSVDVDPEGGHSPVETVSYGFRIKRPGFRKKRALNAPGPDVVPFNNHTIKCTKKCQLQLDQCELKPYIRKYPDTLKKGEIYVDITAVDRAGNEESKQKKLLPQDLPGVSRYPAAPNITIMGTTDKTIKFMPYPYNDCFHDDANFDYTLYVMKGSQSTKTGMKPETDSEGIKVFRDLNPETEYKISVKAVYGFLTSEPTNAETKTTEETGVKFWIIILVLLLILFIAGCICLAWIGKKRGWARTIRRGGGHKNEAQSPPSVTAINGLNDASLMDTYGNKNIGYSAADGDEDDLDDLAEIYDIYETKFDPNKIPLLDKNDFRIQPHALDVKGKFAEFHKAQYQGTAATKIGHAPVVIKQLKASASDSDKKLMTLKVNFFRDSNLDHSNVIKVLGIVGSSGVVMEYYERGVLREWLKSHPASPENIHLLQNITAGIVQGMQYLHTAKIPALQGKPLVHKKLHSKNILLDVNLNPRITGFGPDRKDDIGHSKHDLRPVRWLAPEILGTNTPIYTTSSDVWSFGVVSWEIYSGGKLPYQEEGKNNADDIIQYLSDGNRLTKPNGCPQQTYEVMKQCWNVNNYGRPSFDMIGSYLPSV